MDTFITIYDTTLRDGAQTSGVDFSVSDKQCIAQALNDIHIDYIEGGWNGANPTDSHFFQNLPILGHSQVTSFGMTKRWGKKDDNFELQLTTKVPVITLVGKTWDFHVLHALGISLQDNLSSIESSVKKIIESGKQAFFDAEHFFDGFKHNRDYALKCVQAAYHAGAQWVILCDTNGGTLPDEIAPIIQSVSQLIPGSHLGIHCHNDTGNAIANTLMAVQAGVRHVQGTINGLGERCGNADLLTIIPNLVFKMGYTTSLTASDLQGLTSLSAMLYDRLNQPASAQQPYVGRSAFAHKGGLHVSAIAKNSASYEHISPELIGNARKILLSGQSGKSNIVSLLNKIGIEMPADEPKVLQLLQMVKKMEHQGYAYEHCLASFEILARKFLFGLPTLFTLEAFRVINERRHNAEGNLETMSDATVKLTIGDTTYIEACSGSGPVDALNQALIKTLSPMYPTLLDLKLVDYKVRIFDSNKGTGANTRVMIESADSHGNSFNTVGISPDIIDASFQALSDSIIYKLSCLDAL